MDNRSHREGESVNSTDFRKELMKIMPGYEWTVHRQKKMLADITGTSFVEATGRQSSGFNRLSTLHVARREKDGVVKYEVKSAGNGAWAYWEHTNTDGTLPRALRGLQDHYERRASHFQSLAARLESGRKPPEGDPA